MRYKFALKYVQANKPNDLEKLVNDIKRDLLDAYENYVNANRVSRSNNIVPLLAALNEPHCIKLIHLMEKIISELDGSLNTLFTTINFTLSYIDELKNNKTEVRQNINEILPRAQREIGKNKFEKIVFDRLTNILNKQATKLNKLLGLREDVHGERQESQVKEPSKQDIFMFRFTPQAVHYGLDEQEIFSKIWDDPALKPKLIKLIYSSKRKDGTYELPPEAIQELKYLMELFKNKYDFSEPIEER